MNQPSTMDGLAAVLWDMDGTLVDSEKLWDIALYEAAQWLGGMLTPEQRGSLVGTDIAATARYLLRLTGHPIEDGTIAEVEEWIRARTLSLFADELPWQPGAREALSAVRAAGLPCALVTSTERPVTELALDTIGREFFDVTVCGDEVGGLTKPHPEPYRKAARLLRVDTRACVAVEDSPVGTESAVTAGCTVLVVPGAVPVEPGPGRVIRSSLVGVDAVVLDGLLRDL